MKVIVAPELDSPARVRPPTTPPLVVGAVQTRWHPDAREHADVLSEGVLAAAGAGAQVVFLPELTLSRYPADTVPSAEPGAAPPCATAEELPGGPTHRLAAELATRAGVYVQASLYERADAPENAPGPAPDGMGYNTAILVAPDGSIVQATRKLHIPVTAGYFEDRYFRPGPAGDPYPVAILDLPGAPRIGLPTCWDEWFPEVARCYRLAGAQLLVYPTAIGSEPDHPDFDTEPLWRHVIVGHAIANGLFVVAPNRWGDEGLVTFYGSSFIADPYGRVLVKAPRAGDAVLVAALDLDQGRDWIDLFPFPRTRRPDTYGLLTRPTQEDL